MPEVELTRIGDPMASDPYSQASGGGFDRFGRLASQQWQDTAAGAGNEIDVLHATHGYDRASNRLFADRHVYKSHSQAYQYDDLHRLTDFKTGATDYDGADLPDGIESHWRSRWQAWQLDQLGNQLAVRDFGRADWYVNQFNAANEFDDEPGARKVERRDRAWRANHNFNQDVSDQFDVPGSGDGFQIADDLMEITDVAADTIDGHAESRPDGQGGSEPDPRIVILLGRDVGPHYMIARTRIPEATGYAGVIFGYKGPDDYWMSVNDIEAGKRYLYHVVDGNRGEPIAQSSSGTSAGSLFYWNAYFHRRGIEVPSHTFPDGFPSARVGVVASVVGT
ncbi:MAG: hypothetical protein WD118_01570, partial [Phycisphaeraceae bacterium]